jgi:uncharacterized protein involved in type VI secretion and phage assembly
MAPAEKLYGKYRGTVVNNVDPVGLGRIEALVPDVSHAALANWAMPCAPVAGSGMGIWAVPPVGAHVWIEFERGDRSHPIWTGGYWTTAADTPGHGATPTISSITLQTSLQNALTISDLPGPTGGIMLKSTTGAMILVNDTGIYIQNGKGASSVMAGPAVTINDGALTIT